MEPRVIARSWYKVFIASWARDVVQTGRSSRDGHLRDISGDCVEGTYTFVWFGEREEVLRSYKLIGSFVDIIQQGMVLKS